MGPERRMPTFHSPFERDMEFTDSIIIQSITHCIDRERRLGKQSQRKGRKEIPQELNSPEKYDRGGGRGT
jgi:hypothetical protein